MPKIHFVSLFGVDLDTDIMAHWCRHYLRMGYDSYTVFLHTSDPSSSEYEFARHGFESAGFSVKDAPREPYITAMRNDILSAFAQSLEPSDYMVVADSDEFHVLPPQLCNSKFRDVILSCDVLHGLLVDRWDDTLHEADPRRNLDAQYPHEGNLFQKLYESSEDPEKGRWWRPNPNKILAARAGFPVAHLGSHTLYTPCRDAKVIEGCSVKHFKWRHTIDARLRTKWYHREGFSKAVADFFHTSEAAPCELTC